MTENGKNMQGKIVPVTKKLIETWIDTQLIKKGHIPMEIEFLMLKSDNERFVKVIKSYIETVGESVIAYTSSFDISTEAKDRVIKEGHNLDDYIVIHVVCSKTALKSLSETIKLNKFEKLEY